MGLFKGKRFPGYNQYPAQVPDRSRLTGYCASLLPLRTESKVQGGRSFSHHLVLSNHIEELKGPRVPEGTDEEERKESKKRF